jgi:hypothetical protein
MTQVRRERGQETDRDDALEKEVSEVEDNTEYDTDQETTDVEPSSDEEEDPAEVVVTFRVKEWTFFLVFIPTSEERSVVRLLSG